MKKHYPFFLLFFFILFGCASPSMKKATAPVSTLGTFKGTLPCADCSGLETELTLNLKGPEWAEGNYVLKETYLGKSKKPFVTRGEWTTLRGTPKNENAVVYQLEPDHYDQSRCFLKVNENKIRMLDRDQNDIPAPFPMVLFKLK